MRVAFAGTPEFAAAALAAIHEAGHDIVLVLTQPDRPAGRGLQLHASPVKQFAVQHGLPVVQPMSLKLHGKYPDQARAAQDILRDSACDVMVVAAYGLILPPEVLAIPAYGCLNIHASLLPRWRGAAPIHRAIEAGDAETGITIMQMDEGLDTGAMIGKGVAPIASSDTTATLHDRLAKLGAAMIVRTLGSLQAGPLSSVAQPAEGVTYAEKISKDEAALDFSQAASVLERKIRALNPAPGASTILDGMQLKIWRAAVVDAPAGSSPGQSTMRDGAWEVVCGSGALHLLELQKAGGRRMAIGDFLKGIKV